MSVALILLIAVVLVSIFCVGLVALSSNLSRLIRVYFSIGITGIILWVVALYLSNVESDLVLFFNRAVYIGPIISLLALSFFFGELFVDRAKAKWRTADILALVLALAGISLALTSRSVESVLPRFEGGVLSGYNIQPGPLLLAVVFVIFWLAFNLIARLLYAYKRADEIQKRPFKLVLRAATLALVASLATNAIAPLLISGSSIANALSNIAIIIFIATVAYSALRYSFLDIRLLVVRSIGYVVGLATILLIVISLQLVLFRSLGDIVQSESQQLFVLSALIVLGILIFNPVRNGFTRATSRVFFKDTYDPAKFVTRFNSILVSQLDINELLLKSTNALSETLKGSFCSIGLEKVDGRRLAILGNRRIQLADQEDEALLKYLKKGKKPMLSKGLSHDIPSELAALMKAYDIELLIRLVDQTTLSGSGVGLLVLGSKKNGENYNKTDLTTLKIVANELVLAIQNALRFEEIQRFNVTLQDRVEEATADLKRANAKLRKLDQTKDDFISMASHQLRTPLTSVKGYVSMVLDGDGGKLTGMQKKLLNQSFVSAQRMVYLISDLLNVSRLKTGKFVIENKQTNLAQVVEEETSQLIETAKARNLQLNYNKPKNFPTLMLDETKLRQVIMNFADNAIYYTPRGGKIDISLVETQDSIELTVKDNGMGVPKHEQHNLFTKFYRARNAKSARPDGTGLGLFMAKNVIIAQGGEVIFHSQEGKGSTFGFRFPKNKLQAPAPTHNSGD